MNATTVHERESDASACKKRQQAFAPASVRELHVCVYQEAARHQAVALAPERERRSCVYKEATGFRPVPRHLSQLGLVQPCVSHH